MSVYVFVGPTLPLDQARRALDAVFLPPASQGDVYRLTQKNPEAIGIIDGAFLHTPSVWHKEILWALHHGIPVYGSASMGALRAAELYPFGMRGVGKVFEAYRDGILEDDDEVAVVSATAEHAFRALSEAMVDVRATLEAAEESGVLSQATRAELIRLMKRVPYPSRDSRLLVALGRQHNQPTWEINALEAWLPNGHRAQKREDALEMLAVMRRDVAAGGFRASAFPFEHTQFFEFARRSAGEQLEDRTTDENGRITLEDLLDELRLDPSAYIETRNAALLRCLGLRESQRGSMQVDSFELRAAATEYRRARNLHSASDTDLWLSVNDMTPNQFRSLIREEVLLQRISELVRNELGVHMRSVLRKNGRFSTLAAHIYDKRRVLSSIGVSDLSPIPDVPSADEVLEWYFTSHLATSRPDDIAAHCRALGFKDEEAFVAAVRRQLWYVEATRDRPDPPVHNIP